MKPRATFSGRTAAVLAAALLAACGGGDVDDGTGSRQGQPPTLSGVAGDPEYAWINQAVQLQAQCLGQPPLAYEWRFDGGGALVGDSDTVARTFAPKASGIYDLDLTCRDTFGGTARRTLKLEVYQRDLSTMEDLPCEGGYPGHGWCRQQPQIDGPLFRQVVALDADTLWGIGRDGDVLRSRTDGKLAGHLQRVRAFAHWSRDLAWAAHERGIAVTREGGRDAEARWFTAWPPAPAGSAPAPAVPAVKQLRVMDANNVWALADTSVLRTTDGGKTWAATAWSAAGGKVANALAAFSPTTAWVVGRNGLIEATRDGGKTWAADAKAAALAASGVEFTTAEVSPGRSVAWVAAADGSVLQYATAPQAWTVVRGPTTPPERIASISHRDGSAWLAGWRPLSVGSGTNLPVLWRVTGVNTATVQWNAVTVGPPDSVLRSVSAYRADAAWVAGDRALYQAVGNGPAVVRHEVSGSLSTLRALSAANVGVAWAVGDGRRVQRTPDGGQHWLGGNGHPSLSFTGVLAIDALTAWAVAGTPELFKTQDGSATAWQAQLPASAAGLAAAASAPLVALSGAGSSAADWAAGRAAAWVAGRSGTVLRTLDAGSTWAVPPCTLAADVDALAVASRASDAAWVVGRAASATVGRLHRVGQAGTPCGEVSLSGAADVRAVSAGTAQEVWALGRNAAGTTLVWRTNNAGGSWQTVALPALVNVQALAAGTGGLAWATTPSALWRLTAVPGGIRADVQADLGADLLPVLALQALDNQTLWGVGTSGQVWKSLTGGNYIGNQGPRPARIGPP